MTAIDAPPPFTRETRLALLPALLRERILVLDGTMGTMLQRHRFTEEDFRGARFADHPKDLRGNNDLLCLTRPDAVRAMHAAYLQAGADLVSTNSFTATRIAQADYGLEHRAREINTMRGYATLPPDVVADDAVLDAWLARAIAHARTLPAKG
jgi:5-methyltetrahydrofolate--homocysteine methyltransferase